MRLAPFALAAALAGSALAQPKISPRIEREGGSAYVFVFRPGADMAAARDRLREQGFDLIEHPDLRPEDVVAAGPQGRVARIAQSDDVVYVMPAAPALVSRQRLIACSGPAIEDGVAGEYAAMGQGWSREGSGAVQLRYAFESITGKLDAASARAQIEMALREWEKHANLRLSPSTTAGDARTIAIRFAEGGHGDGYPFDGAGGRLAHTFYPNPPNAEPIAGNMHFDAAESWGIGSGIDLYTVALHEAGHALGLRHSDEPGAVMYPYYHRAAGLTTDDIAGIQALYGPPQNSGEPATPAQPPVQPPSPPPAQPPPTSDPAGDKTPPALRITSPPTTNVLTTAASLAIAGTATDGRGVTEVRWTSSTGGGGVASGTSNWSATVPLYIGSTVITVRAYDAAGNSSWRSVTVTRR